LREEWVDRLIDMGVLYTWYHVYRPMGPDPAPELALTPQQQRKARQFVVDMRCKKPIIIIDAYYDARPGLLTISILGGTSSLARSFSLPKIRSMMSDH